MVECGACTCLAGSMPEQARLLHATVNKLVGKCLFMVFPYWLE